MKQVKRGTMVRISARFGGKRFDATGSAPNQQNGRVVILNSLMASTEERFHQSWTKLGVSNAGTIEYDFLPKFWPPEILIQKYPKRQSR